MDLEGANVASNANVAEAPPTTSEIATAMDVATSSNGDTMFTPNLNTIETPNAMETQPIVEVSTSSNADTKISTNVHGMESINTTEIPIAMELSTSNKVDIKMTNDGSSSVAMLKVVVDEREDSKERKSPSSMVTESFDQVIIGQSIVRVENYNQEENTGNSPLLQDDMFSLAELSVVENQQLDETNTVYTADIVTSVSDQCYESLLGSGQLATTISGSGENCENKLQGVTKVTESIKSPMPIDDTIGKENIEQVVGHADVGHANNGSIGDLENDYTCIDRIPNAGGSSAGHDGEVKDHENKIDNGHLLPQGFYDVANASIDDNNESKAEHGNQVTLSKSLPEAVMVNEMNDRESMQAERAGMKEEQGSFNEQEFEMASVKEEEACQQNLPERIPCVKQAELEVKQQSEDNKSEEMEIPISGVAVSIDEGSVYMDIDHPSQGPPENLMQANNMPQEIVSIKEEIDPQELSQNISQLEKASENSPNITSQNIIPKEANAESHTEHVEYEDGNQLQEISEEFELLKGRKVYKKFGRKKFLGEVIGYDLTTKWFKVLYEDGDEEELEKNELDSILLPLDEKLVASRKRRLPTNDDDNEDACRSGRKLIKRNMQATPRNQGKSETAGNEITVSNKKTKPSAVKSGGKGKSTKVSVPKTQKAKNQSARRKKSIEKVKSEKKTQSTQSKRKPNNQMKQSSSKKPNVEDQNQNHSITRKLKYGSARKTSTKENQKAEEIKPKDKEVKTPQLSMTREKSAAAKRKAGTDVQGRASTVSGKRVRGEMVNDMESLPLRKTEPKRRRIPEDNTEVHLQEKAENNDTNVDSTSLPTGKRPVRSDKGSVLVGRKVRKDFGGEFYGGEIVGYRMYYNVKYDDGDTEDLTWKELESILLPEQGGSSQPQHDKHNTEIEVNPVKSKQKKKLVI